MAKRILLVEDNETDCRMVERALKHLRHPVQLFVQNDGSSAINFLKESENMPDLILLDLKLPKVDGPEILKWLNEHPKLKTVPVVMVTSSDEPGDILRCYRGGANSYVRKPEDYDAYTKMITDIATYWLRVNQPYP